MVFLDNVKNAEPQKIFLVLGLIFGLCSLILIPPFQIADESSHFYRAFQVSDGHFGTPEGSSGYIPKSVNVTTFTFTRSYNPQHFIEDSMSLLNLPLNANDKTYIKPLKYLKTDPSIIPIANYSPTPYLAVVFVILVGKAINLSPLTLMYLGRFANLLLWLFLIYFAIKITPIHKRVFLLLALMPTAIFQGASLSADSFTIAVSFLLIAFIFKLSFDSNKKIVTKKDIFVLLILMLLLVYSKSAYVFLTFLVLLIPSYKFDNRKRMLLTYLPVFTIFFVTLFYSFHIINLINPKVTSVADPRLVQGAANHISDIYSHPFSFLSIVSNTFIQSNLFLNPLVCGLVGFDHNYQWDWRIVYVLFMIFVAFVDQNKARVTAKCKLISFGVVIISVLGLTVISFIDMTPVGSHILQGIQGRYFIPLAPLLFLLFYNNELGNRKLVLDVRKNFNIILISAVLISFTWGLFLMLKFFYITYIPFLANIPLK